MNETTLAKLLQDCAAALRGSLGLKVEVGFCREPFYQTLSQPVLALQIEEAKLSDSAFSQTVGWGKNGVLEGQLAEVTLSGTLFLPLREATLRAETVFETFFQVLSGAEWPFTAFLLRETGFLDQAQCLEAKMTASGKVLLATRSAQTPLKTVRLAIGEVH